MAQGVVGAPSSYRHDQYLRRYKLTLSGGGGVPGASGLAAPYFAAATSQRVLTSSDKPGGVDLRMRFSVRQADSQTPNTAEITIYNLKDQTAMDVIKEFDKVILEAGYITGSYGVIFSGTIAQYKKGKESATDTYLTLYCYDGDVFHNGHNVINETRAAGEKVMSQHDALVAASKKNDPTITTGQTSSSGLPGGVLPRPRTQVGLVIDHFRVFDRSNGTVTSVQNGELQVCKQGEYLDSEIVKLTAATGLIGMPEATQEGVKVTCLLNPRIRVRGRIQLEDKGISQYYVPGQTAGSSGTIATSRLGPYGKDVEFLALVTRDGIYEVRVIDYEGDTRGLPWYCQIICLATDSGGAVQGDVIANTPAQAA